MDVERGLASHNHGRDDSFDSVSLVITEIQDDSIFCNTNNTTMASDDLAISPRKCYSMRGRPRYLSPGSDIRKAKKSHSWHNLRYKRYRRSAHKFPNREDSTQMAGESITTVTDTTTSFNGFFPAEPIRDDRADTLIDVSTELYQNVTAGTVDSEDRSSPDSYDPDAVSTDIDFPPYDASVCPKLETTHTPAPAPIQDDTEPVLSGAYVGKAENYDVIPPDMDTTDDNDAILVLGTPQQERKQENTGPIPSETQDSSVLGEAPLEEATTSTFVQPKTRSMLARPSLDLAEGHVMGMTLGYEIGDLPLEENRPHPTLHKRSFTALPLGEDVNHRRSVFQEHLDRSDDSEPQVFVLLNNATPQEGTENT